LASALAAVAACVRGGFEPGTFVFGDRDAHSAADHAVPTTDVIAAPDKAPATDATALWPGCVADVAVGTVSTCVLFRDRHVECTGLNSRGQLGDGTLTSRQVLSPVVGVSDVVRVDAASWGYCAVRGDATAWCWGDPSSGRFGSLGPDYVKVPTRVPELENVRELKGGSTQSCAVLTSSDVVCMGANNVGQLGDPSAPGGPTPVPVRLGQPVIALASCWDGEAVVLADGSAMRWGYTGGSTSARPEPVGLSGISALSAHAPSFFALKQDGTVWAWGRNESGQLGDGTTINRKDPVRVGALENAISVAGGGTHACAVLAGGAVRCWGANEARLKLGVDGLTASSTPLAVPRVPPARVVRAGQEHSCAIVEDGAVWCWGHNASGELGIGSSSEGQLPIRMLITCP
jgi:alpha-tubulin suppressor-like RCC1 family protein